MNDEKKEIKNVEKKKEKKKSQVFNKEVSLQCLYTTLLDILEKICLNTEETEAPKESYLITKAVFKRADIHNLIAPFIASLKPYYYLSKQHYVERAINYNNFITILRQLCNVNNIKYESKIVYIKSNYEIEYTIYL
jgi:hypothetical protein